MKFEKLNIVVNRNSVCVKIYNWFSYIIFNDTLVNNSILIEGFLL